VLSNTVFFSHANMIVICTCIVFSLPSQDLETIKSQLQENHKIMTAFSCFHVVLWLLLISWEWFEPSCNMPYCKLTDYYKNMSISSRCPPCLINSSVMLSEWVIFITMSFDYNYQNPSHFPFLMQIRATLLLRHHCSFRIFKHNKRKMKWILVVVWHNASVQLWRQ